MATAAAVEDEGGGGWWTIATAAAVEDKDNFWLLWRQGNGVWQQWSTAVFNSEAVGQQVQNRELCNNQIEGQWQWQWLWVGTVGTGFWQRQWTAGTAVAVDNNDRVRPWWQWTSKVMGNATAGIELLWPIVIFFMWFLSNCSIAGRKALLLSSAPCPSPSSLADHVLVRRCVAPVVINLGTIIIRAVSWADCNFFHHTHHRTTTFTFPNSRPSPPLPLAIGHPTN
jgi:hypothetical protein